MSRAVVIRADGSHGLGHGHVFRTLTLAGDLASRGWRPAYVCRDLRGAPMERIRTAGYELVTLDADLDEESDALETALVAQRLGARWIIVDRYDTGHNTHKIWRARGLRILAIDDLCDHAFPVDILLNQNTDAEQLRYVTAENTRRLLGPKYALIRGVYRRARPVALRAMRQVRHLLVCMGGSDPQDVTSAVLRCIEPCRDTLEIDVIVGAAYRPIESLRRLSAQSRHRVRLYRDLPDLVAPMQSADVAVVAGGSITWELCCMGLAIVMCPFAANQEGIVASMTALGAAARVALADGARFGDNAAQLPTLLREVSQLARLRENAHRLVDGQGATRVAETMEAMS